MIMADPILVIEDDKFISEKLREKFTDEGYLVCGADDGAMALLMTRAQQFSLIILDLIMPVMDGFDFLRKFRESDKKTPVIMYSHFFHDKSREMAKELGADSFLIKSGSFDEIINLVNVKLGKHHDL